MRLYTGMWIDASPSKSVAAFRLDFIEADGTARLSVEFVGGGTYEYFKVPLGTAFALIQAESRGQYFARNVKGHFTYRQVLPKWTQPA